MVIAQIISFEFQVFSSIMPWIRLRHSLKLCVSRVLKLTNPKSNTGQTWDEWQRTAICRRVTVFWVESLQIRSNVPVCKSRLLSDVIVGRLWWAVFEFQRWMCLSIVILAMQEWLRSAQVITMTCHWSPKIIIDASCHDCPGFEILLADSKAR